jgi:hypothetical protein
MCSEKDWFQSIIYHLCHGKDEDVRSLWFIALDVGVTFGMLYSDVKF